MSAQPQIWSSCSAVWFKDCGVHYLLAFRGKVILTKFLLSLQQFFCKAMGHTFGQNYASFIKDLDQCSVRLNRRAGVWLAARQPAGQSESSEVKPRHAPHGGAVTG